MNRLKSQNTIAIQNCNSESFNFRSSCVEVPQKGVQFGGVGFGVI